MPHYVTQEIENIGCFSVWKLTETEEELLSLRNFSTEEKMFLSNISNSKRRIEWLASRILLQEILGEDFQTEYLSNGKPILIHPKCFLSISHSKDFVAVIVSQQKEVGIDIEKIRDNMETLKDKFLSPEELQTINTSDNLLLHLYWGAKEAMYKIYSSFHPLFTEHLFLSDINLEKQTATGIFAQENIHKTVSVSFLQIEDNLLVCCWEKECS